MRIRWTAGNQANCFGIQLCDVWLDHILYLVDMSSESSTEHTTNRTAQFIYPPKWKTFITEIEKSSEIHTKRDNKNKHQLAYIFDAPLPLNCMFVAHTTPTGSLAKFLQAEGKQRVSPIWAISRGNSSSLSFSDRARLKRTKSCTHCVTRSCVDAIRGDQRIHLPKRLAWSAPM